MFVCHCFVILFIFSRVYSACSCSRPCSFVQCVLFKARTTMVLLVLSICPLIVCLSFGLFGLFVCLVGLFLLLLLLLSWLVWFRFAFGFVVSFVWLVGFGWFVCWLFGWLVGRSLGLSIVLLVFLLVVVVVVAVEVAVAVAIMVVCGVCWFTTFIAQTTKVMTRSVMPCFNQTMTLVVPSSC